VAYVEYSKTSKKHNGRSLLLLTLNYTAALLGLAIFGYKAIIVMVMGHQLLTINQPLQSLPKITQIQ